MNAQFSRRDLLKLAGASALLAGCASTPEVKKPIARVIVIGGGYGGATAARYIRAWGGGAIEVFLIERNTQFVSCPLSNLVLGGSRLPNLSGQPSDYIAKQLRDFRDGKRPATIMHQISKGYTEPQIDALAAFFAAQKTK